MKYSSALSILIISLFLFLSFSSLVSAQKPKCHPQDHKAVKQIQAAFGIDFTGDCCVWEFITCDDDPPYRVHSINVYDSNISSQIPAAIGDLSSLRILVFKNVSNLTGNIPSAITKLSNLETLIIVNTSISGSIPTFPVNKNLTLLDLSYNALTGSIPPQLSTWLPNLSYIDLQKNKLTGAIPESFGHFPVGGYLSLSHNRLTGAVPKSLGNLDPYSINLSGNRFSGDATFLFGKNKTTRYMYLQRNNFTFNFSKVETTTSFEDLQLSHNNIFGSLPQKLTEIISLKKFNVSYNRLCGKIPQGGRLQKFGITTYFHNECLCGAPLLACVSWDARTMIEAQLIATTLI